MNLVINKFFWPFEALHEELYREFGRDCELLIHVRPGYKGVTDATLTLEDRHVLYAHHARAESLRWPDEATMRRELREWYETTRKTYKEVSAQSE